MIGCSEIGGWTPVLDGSLRESAHGVVEAIVADLAADRAARLPGGSDPFVSILFAEASRALDRPALLACAVDRLNAAIRVAADMPPARIGLYKGWCSLAWVASWLRASAPRSRAYRPSAPQVSEARTELCGAIDERLERVLEQWDPAAHEYDLLSGLVGIGVYALQRRPRPAADRILDAVLTHLSNAAVAVPGGVAWRTPAAALPATLRERMPGVQYNVGVAHGVPGVLVLLGYLFRSGLYPERSRQLAEAAAAWVLAQELPEGEGARYPHWVCDGLTCPAGRMAWCYGGLGVSVAIMSVARSMQRADWQRAAVRMALLEAEREWSRTGVIDACLCHGAAGNALIFQRFYMATGEPRFRQAARAWFERTLEMRTAGEGIGGYRFEDRGQLAEDAAFLTGSGGVALALLAGASDTAPGWDRLLLTDIPA